jgi:hypothetical protein
MNQGGHELEKDQKKALHSVEGFLDMARPAGFEPTTPWFVAKYSIQLSYGRLKEHYCSTI